MATVKITRKTVEKIEPLAKPYVIYDTDIKGFGIRVMPSGIASYIVEYRPGEGGRGVFKRRMAIGRTNELTPEEARKLAQERLGEVRKGEDPLLERETRRKEMKLSELIDKWEKENPPGRRTGKPMTEPARTYTLSRLRNHVVPTLGNKRVSAVDVDDVNALIQKITRGETKQEPRPGKKRGRIIIKGGEGSARKVASDLSIIYGYAVERKIVATNPVSAARKPKAGKRQDYLRPEDFQAMATALDELQAEGVSEAGITILRLILMTGARPSEIEGLKWSEVDFEAGCLRLTKSKTGYSVRPISPHAITILKNISRIENTPYVFPATRGKGHYQGSKKIWNNARDKAKLPDRVRYHARHAMATFALSNGHDVMSVATIMGHTGPRTTLSTYAHVVNEKATKAAEHTGNHIVLSMKKPNASETQIDTSTVTG